MDEDKMRCRDLTGLQRGCICNKLGVYGQYRGGVKVMSRGCVRSNYRHP